MRKLIHLRQKDEESAHPTVTSNMFDPTDEETAMSPLPCFATKTLVIRSGTEVPAAKKVRPITCKKGRMGASYGRHSTFQNQSQLSLAYHRRNPDSVSHNRRPPDHEVGVDGNPNNAPDECDGIIFSL